MRSTVAMDPKRQRLARRFGLPRWGQKLSSDPILGTRVLALRAPLVNAFMAPRIGEQVALPELRDCAALLFRRRYRVQMLELNPWQGDAISQLIDGVSIAQLERVFAA